MTSLRDWSLRDEVSICTTHEGQHKAQAACNSFIIRQRRTQRNKWLETAYWPRIQHAAIAFRMNACWSWEQGSEKFRTTHIWRQDRRKSPTAARRLNFSPNKQFHRLEQLFFDLLCREQTFPANKTQIKPNEERRPAFQEACGYCFFGPVDETEENLTKCLDYRNSASTTT